jgi:hypothetical protein
LFLAAQPIPCFPSHQRERERGRESQESGKKKKKKKKVKGVGVFKKAHGEMTKLAR